METVFVVVIVFISRVTSAIWTDLAQFSNISTSHTCKTSGPDFVCNDTCQVTDSTDSGYDAPLFNGTIDDCGPIYVSGIPIAAKPINGNITFGGENCTRIKNATFNGTSWTISFWVKLNGTYSRTLLEVQSNNTSPVSINSSHYQIGANSGYINLHSDEWTLIVLRMTGKKVVYLDINGMNKDVREVPNISRNIYILFGPQTNASAYVQMVDARIYNHCLTDREIKKLYNGTLAPTLALQDKCLCLRDFPTILPGPLNHGIFCMDYTNKSVYRLNNDTNHPVQYAVDGDVNTYWNSGTTQSSTITLDLKDVYQLTSIELNFLFDTIPSELVFTLTYNGKLSMSNICGCNSSLPCKRMGGIFTYNLTNGTDLTNRTIYNTLLADQVKIQLNGRCSNKTFYAVSEISITGSCHCSGNSENCTMFSTTNRKYSCVCKTASHTNGSNCETCMDGFWRKSTFDLSCQNPCICNITGSTNMSCNKTDGQCYCKSNVTGVSCDQCQHNSYNFSSNGCTGCQCNPDGIIECNFMGQCVCKPNVETISGKCESCIPKYYGFRNKSGCIECGCNDTGAYNLLCSDISGECNCKPYLTGRTCDKCKDQYWNFDKLNANICKLCDCNIVIGSINNICDKISGQCPCHYDMVTNRQCDPELAATSMTPTFGPIAGGTYVTLSGRQLSNQDENVAVILGRVPANIITRTSTTIVFETMNSSIGLADVTIIWVKGKPPYNDFIFPGSLKFEYRVNAVIQEPSSNLKSFSSGGCNIELKGRALDSVYSPKIILYGIDGATDINGTCSHTSGGSSILCKPPNVSTWVTNGTYSYGVVLDGITDYLKITTSVIEIQPDPTFYTSGEIVYRNVYDKFIIVRGEGFRRACDKRDFRLHLSKRGDCEIKDFTDTEITCDPKETFPGTGEKEALKIYIGVLEKDVGVVEFRTFWKLQEFIYISLGLLGFMLIVVITIIVCCIRCRRYKNENEPTGEHRLEIVKNIFKRERKKAKEYSKDTNEKEESIVEQNETEHYCQLSFIEREHPYVGEASPVIPQSVKDLNKSYSELFMDRLPQNVAELLSTSVIDESHIEPGNIYTIEGTFTRVVKGKYVSRSSTPYAGDCNTIKTLVQNYPAEGEIPKWLSLGLQECTRLRDVVHEKVLRLRGIAIDAKRIYVVYPAMKRNLKEYIKKTYDSQVINIEAVIRHCLDVGEGMMELHRRGIIHKDLAARNCMVDSAKVVKVADAAFASDLYPNEYVKQENRDLPVRWMAVESLQHISYYDKATDVWSYGVLLWEIFTGCRNLPYNELPDNDIYASVVMRDYRIRKPENIPEP
ncbi:hypothetical protein CHS0354_014628 [Potamilus streckersoni]|uniref:Receptor protein-tyrosine kinase n=1 Tax=Potamilus streckersoni TaxID=2493646 RepID=A0AAE0SPT5_9BIVA|nr:hypothetical protein CHS0354_014628 [Potamilus streckersoni]